MKRIQLFLLPYAGGSILSFMKLKRFLSNCIEAIPVEYSGRGSRKNEKLLENYTDFCKDVVINILNKRNNKIPFALLGYSMGSIITYDILSKNIFDQEAKHCFFCAESSPIETKKIDNLSNNKELCEKLYLLGGVKETNSQSNEFSNIINLIKNDYNVLSQYKYDGSSININSSIIYSIYDKTCTNMENWSRVISGSINYYQIGMNHFFINDYYRELAEIINKELEKY